MKESRQNKRKKHRRKMMALSCFLCILFCVILLNKTTQASWIEEEDGMKYRLEDGQFAVGFLDVEAFRYYFDADGHLVKGKFYVEDEDAYYYSNEEGILQIGVIQTEDNFYITDETGKLQTGFVECEGNRYYFDKIAELVKGWFKHDENWYYSDENGIIMTGFITVDGYRYYLNADGTRVSDAVLSLDGVTYIFNKDGSVDENATALYPVLVFMNQLRTQQGKNELVLNTKVQACAILRAAELVNGFTNDTDMDLEQLLNSRGVSCSGGYEFSYGGIDGYDITRLMSDMQKDVNLMQVLLEFDVSEMGMGVYVKDGLSYYDIIFISKTVTE